MLNSRIVTLYGFVAIAIMAGMLILMWTGVAPRSMFVPMCLIAAALFLIRVTMRLILTRQARADAEEKKGEKKHGG
jgi:hypothetical protein